MNAPRFKFDIRQAGKRLTIGLGLCAVANAAFFFLAVRPNVSQYESLQEGTAPQQTTMARLQAEVEKRETYLAALREAEQDLHTLRDEVLSTREQRMIDVQLEFKELADRFSIDIEQVTFSNELLQEEELDSLVMVVPLEGGYANLRKFLQAVENSSKFLVVERVTLGQGKRGGVMLELSITLATYFDAPESVKQANRENRRGGRRRSRG
jgi:Tfp pilus assembly protein PilO